MNSIDSSRLGTSRLKALIASVAAILERGQVETYLVGGWVRDTLLGRDSTDIDFAVRGDGILVASDVAKAMDGTIVPLDDVNGVGRVVLSNAPGAGRVTLDFAALQGSLADDLARRDFTIDAMALKLTASGIDPEVVDPQRGLDDLSAGIIRHTGRYVFFSDPVRLLRALRLAAGLSFVIEADTESAIRSQAALIARVAPERVREELVLLLSLPASGRFLEYMDSLGLLGVIFPELEGSRGVAQPKEHHWDVLTHSLQTARAFDYLLGQSTWEYAEAPLNDVSSPAVDAYFGNTVGSNSNMASLFRLACLLHDVAKPQTKSVEPTGKVRFLGHSDEGAEVAAGALGRLRFSNREIDVVRKAVQYHMRPTQMGWPDNPSRRAIYRYYRDAGQAAMGIVYLSLADHMAARGPDLVPDGWRTHVRVSAFILAHEAEQPVHQGRLIDGYDIMKSFGLSPGPRLGELIETVREAQAAGEITDKNNALAFVRRILDAG